MLRTLLQQVRGCTVNRRPPAALGTERLARQGNSRPAISCHTVPRSVPSCAKGSPPSTGSVLMNLKCNADSEHVTVLGLLRPHTLG